MRRDSALIVDNRTGPMAVSWLASCLLHGGLAVASLLFVQRIHLAPQADPFQWDVAMVAPLSHAVTATLPAESMAPSTPVARRPLPSTADAPPTVKPVQPRMTTQPSSPLPASAAESISESRPEQPRLTELTQQDSTTSLTATVPSQIAPQPLADPTTSANDSVTSPIGSQQAPTESLPDSSSALTSAIPPTRLASAKSDYGWLASLMAQWIEDLNKRYPAMLRTEGVQGKVTLTAMLHEDGLLSDVRVAKSSGNAALDQVALEDVKNGPPVKLSRPLERSKMSVKFSIVYDLKTAR